MSVTSAVSQTLTDLYPIKVADDFHKYLEEEEYDSEVLRDDLQEDEPFFVEYIIQQNPTIFNDEAEKEELIHNVKTLMGRTQNGDDQDLIDDEASVEIEVIQNAEAEQSDANSIDNHDADEHEQEMEELQNIENVSDDNHQMSVEEEEEASMKLINEIMKNENVNNHEESLSNNKLNDGEWSCQHCTFINSTNTNICSMCSKTSDNISKSEPKAPQNENDEKWDCIYQELENSYLSKDLCNKYYSAVLDIITKHKFEMETAEEDLNEFAAINNESIIAEGLIDKFEWKQNDINAMRLIDCLKRAFQHQEPPIPDKQEVEIYQKKDKEQDIFHVNDLHEENKKVTNVDTWKTRIAVIINLKHDSKHNKKLAKFNLFAKALSSFGQRELCAMLRLWIRQKMIKSTQEFNEGKNIIEWIRNRFEDESKPFNDNDMKDIFKRGFDGKLMGHNSILRKLDPQYQRNIDIPLVQIWMTAIVMKMNQYFVKYPSCHSIFCIRCLPIDHQSNDEQDNKHKHKGLSIFERIQRAFKLLEKSEKDMISNDCWTFVIDLTELNKNNDPEIYFESREIYDDEKLTERRYNNDYKLNQLYHLKRLDSVVCKENDNSAGMALQLSFHKYWKNNCVSYFSHSSGHIPFFENDIIEFIPRLFEHNDGAIQEDEWEDIFERGNITEIKSMDRMYSELEQSFDNFMNKHHDL